MRRVRVAFQFLRSVSSPITEVMTMKGSKVRYAAPDVTKRQPATSIPSAPVTLGPTPEAQRKIGAAKKALAWLLGK